MAESLNTPELERIHAEIAKLMAETIKLNNEAQKMAAETGKITRETFWYPMAVASGLVGVIATVTALIIKLIS